jgi:hypothetical protein
LSPEAAAKVREILGENASLASVASWADDYRALHLDTAGWHFVDGMGVIRAIIYEGERPLPSPAVSGSLDERYRQSASVHDPRIARLSG